MLNAEKKLLISTYHFFDDKEYFGTLKACLLAPKATFIAKEGKYFFSREKWFEGKYFCTYKYKHEALAEKPLGFGYDYLVAHQGEEYHLKPGELFNRKSGFHFELLQNGRKVGTIKENPTKYFLLLDFDLNLPRIIQCFMFWLSYRSWSSRGGWRMTVFDKYDPIGWNALK